MRLLWSLLERNTVLGNTVLNQVAEIIAVHLSLVLLKVKVKP